MRSVAWLALAWWLLCPAPAAADHKTPPVSPLPAISGIDKSAVTVSGLSSGGFFAHQFHVAYSGLVKGAAIAAGGPYACAAQAPLWLRAYPESALTFALMVCSHIWRDRFPMFAFWLPTAPNPETSAADIRSEHAKGAIDPPMNLASARVWLWSGGKDEVVPAGTVRALKRLYEIMGVSNPNIGVMEEAGANHGLPIEQFEGVGTAPSCGVLAPPFLIDCDYDAAKFLFAHLYSATFRPSPGVADRKQLLRFSQAAFPEAADASANMLGDGYVYIPVPCANGAAQCHLHVAFHGCKQSAETVHDAFYWHAGYNRWAEANNIVVLYPQAMSQQPKNPDGCWDWWGYTGPDYHRRAGPQMRAVKAMVDHLLGN